MAYTEHLRQLKKKFTTPPARKKAKVTRVPNPGGPAPIRLSPPPTPPPQGNGEDEAELLVARERTVAAQNETAAAEAKRQATIATIELTAMRAPAAKADAKVQRDKAAQGANEADKRRWALVVGVDHCAWGCATVVQGVPLDVAERAAAGASLALDCDRSHHVFNVLEDCACQWFVLAFVRRVSAL